MAQLVNKTKNQILAARLETARGFLERSRGLLGRKSIGREEALWISPCPSIHTFFMKFAIDCVFVDRDLKVKAVYHRVKPWRLAWPLNFSVRSVVELAEGKLAETGTEIGDQLYVATENS